MKKYKLNGREYATFELSNNQLVELLEGKYGELPLADKADIQDTILTRFWHNCCVKPSETQDELFACQFRNFVNGKMESPKAVARKMGNEHRYLQQEMFKVCLEYIKVLADHYADGHYDARNDSACEMSDHIVMHLEEDGFVI